MNSLKETVITLIFSAVAVGLCELLIPKNSFKNQIRIITGAVLLISMLSPFLGGFEIPEFNPSDFNADYNAKENAERSIAYAAKNEIADIIIENGIEKAKIIINTGLDENNSINIESAVILLDREGLTKSDLITSEIQNSLNTKIQVGEL